jgi:hypothetical protein
VRGIPYVAITLFLVVPYIQYTMESVVYN